MSGRRNKAAWSASLCFFVGMSMGIGTGADVARASSDGRVSLDVFDPQAAVAHSQKAIGRQLEDYTLRDGALRPLTLSSYRGKPLVLNVIFTACTESCPVIVQSLARAVDVANDTLGADGFNVLTVGFDPQHDTPARMRAFAHSQGIDMPNWVFASGDRETVARLTAQVGFLYNPSPRGFDHLAQTTVIDAAGVVYRHIYGADFEPPAVVEPLKDLALGAASAPLDIGALLERVRLFCTFYDRGSERYRFDYSIVIGVAVGVISLAGTGIVAFRSFIAPRGTG